MDREANVQDVSSGPNVNGPQFKEILKEAIREYQESSNARTEPVYKTELTEERKRREALESRVRELEEENRNSQRRAEEADRNATIRAELQKLGVSKVELAYRVVKDDVFRSESGHLRARAEGREMELRDYLTQFTSANPEFLPARISGGSGFTAMAEEPESRTKGVRVDHIKPGMNPEELRQIRLEVARLAQERLKGN